MNEHVLKGFSEELEKIADIVMGPDGAPLVATGLFVGTDSKFKQKAELMRSLISKHKSPFKARELYKKQYPDDFVTMAFKRENPPSMMTRIKRFFGSDAAESASKSYEDRVKHPRAFLRVGPAGGYQQSALYSEVARGLHDNELSQPHVPKKDRVVYL